MLQNDLGFDATQAFSIAPSDCPPSTEEFDDEGNEADGSVATGGYTAAGDFSGAQTWVAKRQLYRRLIATPALMPSRSDNEAFFNNEATTTVGKFEQVRAGMEGLFDLSGSLVLAQLIGNQDDLKGKLGELASIEAALDDDPTPTEEADLLLDRDTVMGEIAALEEDQAGILASITASRIAAAEGLYTMNDTITTAEDYELMQQQVNAVVLEAIIDDTLGYDATQLSTLTSIANSCPYSGGEAVYQARALLGDQVSYDETELCEPPSPLKKLRGDESLTFSLYPNPACGYTNVSFDSPIASAGEIVLTTTLGKQVYKVTIADGIHLYPLTFEGISSGVYHLTIRTEKSHSTKIITIFK